MNTMTIRTLTGPMLLHLNVILIFCSVIVTAVLIDESAIAAQTGYIFVSNEQDDTVSVIDGETLQVIKAIPTGQRPRDMRWSADKNKLLVAVSSDNRIDVIDVAALEVVGSLPAGEDPEMFDIDPSGKILVASNEDDNEITVVDIETATELRVVENVGIEPEGITFHPDGKYVFVTSEATNTIFVVDPWQGVIVDEVLVGNRPRRGAFTPDGKEYWVTNELGASVSILDAENFSHMEDIYFERRGMREEDITPVDFALTADGKTAYITLGRANHVAVVDVQSREVRDYILAGSRVWGAALTADESLLIVTNGASDDISVIDTGKAAAINAIAVGRTPHTVRVDD